LKGGRISELAVQWTIELGFMKPNRVEEFLERRKQAIDAENEAFVRVIAAYEELIRLRQHHSGDSAEVQAAVGNLRVQRQSLQRARCESEQADVTFLANTFLLGHYSRTFARELRQRWRSQDDRINAVQRRSLGEARSGQTSLNPLKHELHNGVSAAAPKRAKSALENPDQEASKVSEVPETVKSDDRTYQGKASGDKDSSPPPEDVLSGNNADEEVDENAEELAQDDAEKPPAADDA
jgi:hypothetical protein